MGHGIRIHGQLEVKFNEDRTQALATILPPREGGQAVTAAQVMERLKAMGVTYGIRERAILDAVHYASETGMAAASVVVAQGALPAPGQDARVTYALPLERLIKPLPKRSDGSGLPDWFALDPEKRVAADTELASIVPPQPGTPGKTLTWPIQTIPPKPGKPCALNAGQNVRVSEDGLHLHAAEDGYVCLHGEQLVVYALRTVAGEVQGGARAFPAGVVFEGRLLQAGVQAGGMVAIREDALGCHIRAHGDVFVRAAENCHFIVSGNLYVTQCLKNCTVNCRRQVIALEAARIVGGSTCATEGVHAVSLGDSDFTETEIETGVDRVLAIRRQEIEKELAGCEANSARITRALKPFTTTAMHESLPPEKRALLQKLLEQRRAQEMRVKELYNEKRALALAKAEPGMGVVTAAGTVHPGVFIRIGEAAFQVEADMERARFVAAPGGKSVQAEPWQQAA